MKIIRIIGFVLAGIIAIVLLIVPFLPNEVEMKRSKVVDAPADVVYNALNGFKYFNDWSPWAQVDENTVYKLSGPEEGVGSVYSWESEDASVGKGTMEIIESKENEEVISQMVFEGMDTAYASYIIKPVDENKTELTWTFEVELEGFGKYAGVMMKQALGPVYEEGLTNFKRFIEEDSNRQLFEDAPAEVVVIDTTVVVDEETDTGQ